MSCNDNNKSLLRLSVTEDNEVILINKKGEIVSRVTICEIVSSCETVTSLSMNETTGVLTYTNEDNVTNTISLCSLFDICSEANNIPPFCITNLPNISNIHQLPSPTVMTFGCTGANPTVVQTYLRNYAVNGLSFTDTLITTPIGLDFLCGITTSAIQIVTVVTNDCGTHTDIKTLNVKTVGDIVVNYCGIDCCDIFLTDVKVVDYAPYIDEESLYSDNTEFYFNKLVNVISGVAFKDLNDEYDVVKLSYYTNMNYRYTGIYGYVTINYGGYIYNDVKSYERYNYYHMDNGLTVLDDSDNTISLSLIEYGGGSVCSISSQTTQVIDVGIPEPNEIPGGSDFVTLNIFNMITLPVIDSPKYLNFIHNRIANNIQVNVQTGEVIIPYSLINLDSAKGYFTVFVNDLHSGLPKIIGLATVNATQQSISTALRLTYTDGSLPNNSLAEWNTFFDLPTNGTPFTSLITNGDSVVLFGGSGITLKPHLFENSTTIKKIVDLGTVVVAVGESAISFCTKLTKVSLPACLSVDVEGLYNNPKLSVLKMENVVTADYAAFGQNPNVTVYNMPDLTTAADRAFIGNAATSYVLTSLTSAGYSCFAQNSGVVAFTLPALLTVGDLAFSYSSALQTILMPILTGLGTTTGQDNVFFLCNNLATLTVPTALATVNAGNADGDLTYAVGSLGVTINFV